MLDRCQKSLSAKPAIHQDESPLYCICHIHYLALSGTCQELKSLNDAKACQRAPRMALCKYQCPALSLQQHEQGGKGEREGTDGWTGVKMTVRRVMRNMVTEENAIAFLTVAWTAQGERTRSNFTHHYFHAD